MSNTETKMQFAVTQTFGHFPETRKHRFQKALWAKPKLLRVLQLMIDCIPTSHVSIEGYMEFHKNGNPHFHLLVSLTNYKKFMEYHNTFPEYYALWSESIGFSKVDFLKTSQDVDRWHEYIVKDRYKIAQLSTELTLFQHLKIKPDDFRNATRIYLSRLSDKGYSTLFLQGVNTKKISIDNIILSENAQQDTEESGENVSPCEAEVQGSEHPDCEESLDLLPLGEFSREQCYDW